MGPQSYRRSMTVLGSVRKAKQNSTQLCRIQESLIELYSNEYSNRKQTPNEAEMNVASRKNIQHLHIFHTLRDIKLRYCLQKQVDIKQT